MTELTNEMFKKLPLGQKMVESCGSFRTFIKAVKVSATEVEILSIDAVGFKAFCKIKIFNEAFDYLVPVNAFVDVNGVESTFEELKDLFLPKFSFGDWANDSCYIIENKTLKVVDTLTIIDDTPSLFSGKKLDQYELEW